MTESRKSAHCIGDDPSFNSVKLPELLSIWLLVELSGAFKCRQCKHVLVAGGKIDFKNFAGNEGLT